MDKSLFGQDMSKWYISKYNGAWVVCPPMTADPKWSERGGAFNTGAEALAAFARGADAA